MGGALKAGRTGGRAAAGIIALSADQAIEDELHALLDGNGLSLFFTRVPSEDRYDLSTLAAIAAHLDSGARTLPPGDAIGVLVYGCTSGTIAVGERVVAERLARARPGLPSTNPLTAAKAALHALAARRIGLLTPYPQPVHDVVAAALAGEFEIAHSQCLGIDLDGEISRVPADRLLGALRPLSRNVDAVFLSCTSLRVARHIDRLEAELGIPIVTSNQAVAWHLLGIVGQVAKVPFGALMGDGRSMKGTGMPGELRLGR